MLTTNALPPIAKRLFVRDGFLVDSRSSIGTDDDDDVPPPVILSYICTTTDITYLVTTTIPEDRYRRISVFDRTRVSWFLWMGLVVGGRSKLDDASDLLDLRVVSGVLGGPPVPPTRFRYRRDCAIGRPKPILLRSQNCLHFGDFRPGSLVIWNPVNFRG